MSALLALLLVAAPEDDAALAQRPTRELVERLVVEGNPSIGVSREREASTRALADVASAFPAPELMLEARQVPFARPGDTQMLAVGVKQMFPAPGARAARRAQREAEATAEEQRRRMLELELRRAVGHAFVDLVEATARHETHSTHATALQRLVDMAQARLPTGGRLDDVIQAQRERARLEADIVAESAGIASAKLRLNALLGRPPDAPLGTPAPLSERLAAGASHEQLLALARQQRPELAEARAARDAEAAMRTAATQEARWPRTSVTASYMPPTRPMPVHAWGLALGAELPWLWGGQRDEVAARFHAESAAALDEDATAWRIGVELSSAFAALHVAAARHDALRDGAVPAAERALSTALAAYRSGQGDVKGVLEAEKAIVELEVELVTARLALSHALVDLDHAVGARAPRASTP